jgi:hypothetical protein
VAVLFLLFSSVGKIAITLIYNILCCGMCRRRRKVQASEIHSGSYSHAHKNLEKTGLTTYNIYANEDYYNILLSIDASGKGASKFKKLSDHKLDEETADRNGNSIINSGGDGTSKKKSKPYNKIDMDENEDFEEEIREDFGSPKENDKGFKNEPRSPFDDEDY